MDSMKKRLTDCFSNTKSSEKVYKFRTREQARKIKNLRKDNLINEFVEKISVVPQINTNNPIFAWTIQNEDGKYLNKDRKNSTNLFERALIFETRKNARDFKYENCLISASVMKIVFE